MKIKFGRFKINIFYLFIPVILIIIGAYFLFFFEKKNDAIQYPAPFLSVDPAWADTTLKYMSLEEKVGQLIWLDAKHIEAGNNDTLISLLNETKPGAVNFSVDSLVHFIKIQNWLKDLSKINFLYSTELNFDDFEIKDIKSVNTFFAVKDDSVRTDYFKNLSKIYKELNVNLCLLPIENKQINDSLYNSDYVKILTGLIKVFTNMGIFTCMQENGFFEQDSIHFNDNLLPVNNGLAGVLFNEISSANENKYDLNNQLRSLYNFGGIKIAHLQNKNVSEEMILSFLNDQTEMFFTENSKNLYDILLSIFEKDDSDIELLNNAVRKVLLAKTWTGTDIQGELIIDSVLDVNNDHDFIISKSKLYKNSISLIRNKNVQIPYKSLKDRTIHLIEIGRERYSDFYETLNQYYSVSSDYINCDGEDRVVKLKKINKRADVIVSLNNLPVDTALLNIILSNKNFKSISIVNFEELNNLKLLDSFKTVIQVYGTSDLEQKYAADAIFGGIDVSGRLAENISDSLVYGTSLLLNKVRVSQAFPEEVGLNSEILLKIDSIANDGIRRGAFPGCQVVVLKKGFSVFNKSYGFHTYSKQRRVRKTDLYDLASVTKIAATTLAAMRMYDSGKLRLSDNLGKFFRDKSIDYSNIKPDTIFNIDTLYFKDITDYRKILKHQDTLHLNDSMFVAYDSLIVTATPKNNIFKVQIRDILLHQSGITPTLPILPYLLYKKYYYDSLELIKERYYAELKKDTINYDPNIKYDVKGGLNEIYDEYFTRNYIKDSSQVKIADGFYLQNRYFDTLWRDTKRLRVYSRKIYQYSDINMILLQQAIDSINRRGIDKYLAYNVYGPMGLKTMCYKPTRYFPRTSITPTENDKYWRGQILRGNVHDPSAAMLGGVSGNAGLFSNAYDLAVLGQMWLNKGTYGGMRFISPATVNKFTGFQEGSHRGLGFDKPTRKSIIGQGAPPESYGHTGFTGTCIWIDPVNEIVYVFLSNRVHPNPKNWRINRYKIRQKIHTVVYDAMNP